MTDFGHDNPTFVRDTVYTIPTEFKRFSQFYPGRTTNYPPPAQFQVRDEKSKDPQIPADEANKRDSWGKG